MIIPLGDALLRRSSNLPAGFGSSREVSAPRRTGPIRHRRLQRSGDIPAYLVLLRVGFTMPRSLLNARCALTAPFHPYLSLALEAVCSLLHWPSRWLEPSVPDVIRHTALRSSDFPLPRLQTGAAAIIRPPASLVYRECIAPGWIQRQSRFVTEQLDRVRRSIHLLRFAGSIRSWHPDRNASSRV